MREVGSQHIAHEHGRQDGNQFENTPHIIRKEGGTLAHGTRLTCSTDGNLLKKHSAHHRKEGRERTGGTRHTCTVTNGADSVARLRAHAHINPPSSQDLKHYTVFQVH